MKFRSGLLTLCAAIALSACAPTQQARETKATSGFLGTAYPLLREGGDTEALLVYRREGVNWGSYNRARLAPVSIWATDESSFADFSPADRHKLADQFYSVIYAEISKDYQMVSAPAEGVLDIQVALTDAEKSDPALDTVSTILPQALAVSALTGVVTGKPAFVGEAQVEAKVLDGGSGDLLGAAVDRRVGGKSISDSVDSWGDVDAAFQHWAQLLRYRLCNERGASDCVQPE